MTPREAIASQIEAQHELQQHLLGLAELQAEVLRIGDIGALNAVVSDQQATVLQLGKLHREWLDQLPEIVADLGLTESVTLTELIDALPDEDRDELRLRALEMRQVMTTLHEQNTRNMEVIAFEAKLDDHFMREIVLQPIIDSGSDMAQQPRLVDVEA